MDKLKIAIIGVGDISGIYLENITNVFREIQIAGVCDLFAERAEAAREKYGFDKIYPSLEALLADPEVDIVLNLTRPSEHYSVTKAALMSGKHVYTEKPLAATFEEGKELFTIAAEKGLRIGGAPDTFLGAGIQTCRKLIEDDFIGDVIGGAAFMVGRGHESWHPSPEFYYKKGGGPMMDMGPYYVTALVNLMGAVTGVTGRTKASFPQRTITSAPKFGQVVDVEAPTYITGIMDFENGAIATIFTTFDVYCKTPGYIEVYGTKGTIYVPDPNTFDGPVRILRGSDGEIREMPLLFDYEMNSRGLGLADMAKAIEKGRPHRADAQQVLHVLEVMTAVEKSGESKSYLELSTKYEKRALMKNNPLAGVLD